MPFRRRLRRRRRRRSRRFRGRRRFRRRRMTLDPERKLVDVNNDTGLLMNFNGSTTLLNSTTAGINNMQRLGIQQLNMSSLFNATMDINTGILPVTIKVWLVWDKQPQGVALTPFDVLQVTGNAGIVTSARRLANALRVRVLWTKRVQLDVFNTIKQISIFRRLRFKTRYVAALGGVAQMESGALWLMTASSIDVAGVQPRIIFNHRLRFVG